MKISGTEAPVSPALEQRSHSRNNRGCQCKLQHVGNDEKANAKASAFLETKEIGHPQEAHAEDRHLSGQHGEAKDDRIAGKAVVGSAADDPGGSDIGQEIAACRVRPYRQGRCPFPAFR